jgi:hypothetical protein
MDMDRLGSLSPRRQEIRIGDRLLTTGRDLNTVTMAMRQETRIGDGLLTGDLPALSRKRQGSVRPE